MERVTVSNTSLPASGLDLDWVDDAVRVQDDLFTHVNGKWLESHTIPEDRSVDGAFHVLRDRAEENVRDIIVEAAESNPESGTDAAKIGDLYGSFMDTEHIEALGIGPISGELEAIASISDVSELSARMGRLQRHGVGGLFGFYVDTDARQSDRYLVHVVQSGLGLPDESYYREDKHAATLDATGRMWRRCSPSPLRRRRRPGGHGTASGDRDRRPPLGRGPPSRRGAHVQPDESRRVRFRGIGFRSSLVVRRSGHGRRHHVRRGGRGAAVLRHRRLRARRPGPLVGLDDLVVVAVAAHSGAVSVLGIRRRELRFLRSHPDRRGDQSGPLEAGRGLRRERDGFAVGRLYVAKHFPPEAKARMDELIGNLVEAYRRNISELEWMTPATREKALTKLGKFTPKIGYPAHWRDYSALTVDRGDLIGNVARAASFEQDREFAKIGAPVDRDEWFMTPQTVNAYYNPGMNEIVFPAAILQPPFFDPDADDAANYGGIGAVIGHEIGHGFDDQAPSTTVTATS